MFQTKVSQTDLSQLSNCRDLSPLMTEEHKGHNENAKADAALAHEVDRALLKDNVLKVIDYYQIDVYVKNGTVSLNGHILNAANKTLIENTIWAIPGTLEIRNNLILDDKLTLEIAASLGKLEHQYGCKFFTSVSHGVVSLNGIVSDENVKSLAEKQAAKNPSVRGVINHVRVSGARLELQSEPFLQPTIGEIIYFLDGVSGIVKQVIINPDNRRVIAMTIQGQFADRGSEIKPLNYGEWIPQRLMLLSTNLVCYLTKVSGFLNISSDQKKQYVEFDPTQFLAPPKNWKPPYPYCLDNVLFPAGQDVMDDQILQELPRSLFAAALEQQPLSEELSANDSLGG